MNVETRERMKESRQLLALAPERRGSAKAGQRRSVGCQSWGKKDARNVPSTYTIYVHIKGENAVMERKGTDQKCIKSPGSFANSLLRQGDGEERKDSGKKEPHPP